jgi:hypothetical protein
MWRGQGPSGKREDILIVLDDDVRKALPHPDYVEADLVNEGFFPTPAYRPEDITEKLKERKWSLIVAGLAHVDEVAAIHGTNRILLVALDASDKEKTAAKKKYSGVITKVAKDFVVDVADALESARLKKNA